MEAVYTFGIITYRFKIHFWNRKTSQNLSDNGGSTRALALEPGSVAMGAVPYADAGSGVWNGAQTSGEGTTTSGV